MHVVYKEMPRGGAKSNVAKWNLISRIQFKDVKKNCLIFMSCSDWVYSNRTLDVVFIVRDGM